MLRKDYKVLIHWTLMVRSIPPLPGQLKDWKSAMLILFCVFILTAGCNNVCDGVVCNNGECADGACVCDEGYEGENCELTANAKFEGLYLFSRVCDSSGGPVVDSISVSPVQGSTDAFTLSGLESSTSLNARVLADGVEFVLPRQSFGQGREIESVSGTISTDAATINLNYKVYDSATDSLLDRCSGSMSK